MDYVDYVALGNNIKKYRQLASMRQSDLAEKCNCSISHIGQIERAENAPSLEKLVCIANALSVTIDQLLCENYKRPESIYLVDIAKRIENFSSMKRIIICESISEYVSALERMEQTR